MATAWLQVTNNAVTTLATAMTAASSTLDVSDAVDMPTAFPFRLTIWDRTTYGDNPGADPGMEIVEVTGLSSEYEYWDSGAEEYQQNQSAAEYGVTRAVEGTTAAVHAAGCRVALLLTAGIIQQIQAAVAALE